LRRRQAARTNSYHFGDCIFDAGSCKLIRKGREIALTPKELGLLTFLLQRAGRALNRDEILVRVWGHSVFVTHRSVDRCINTLRNKIEPDPKQPAFIITIRDVGYRFELPA
jgi:DNA-binding response OmpR family regulator